MARPDSHSMPELPAPPRCISVPLPADHGDFLPTGRHSSHRQPNLHGPRVRCPEGNFCMRCEEVIVLDPEVHTRRLRKVILVVIPILIGAGLLAALERPSSANAPASAPSAPTYASSTLLSATAAAPPSIRSDTQPSERMPTPAPAPRGKRPVRRRHRSPADRIAWHEVRRHRVRPRQVRRREVRRGQVRGRCVRRCSARRHRILACGRSIDFGRTTRPSPPTSRSTGAETLCDVPDRPTLTTGSVNLEKCAAYRELADGLLDGIRSRTRLSVKSP